MPSGKSFHSGDTMMMKANEGVKQDRKKIVLAPSRSQEPKSKKWFLAFGILPYLGGIINRINRLDLTHNLYSLLL